MEVYIHVWLNDKSKSELISGPCGSGGLNLNVSCRRISVDWCNQAFHPFAVSFFPFVKNIQVPKNFYCIIIIIFTVSTHEEPYVLVQFCFHPRTMKCSAFNRRYCRWSSLKPFSDCFHSVSHATAIKEKKIIIMKLLPGSLHSCITVKQQSKIHVNIFLSLSTKLQMTGIWNKKRSIHKEPMWRREDSRCRRQDGGQTLAHDPPACCGKNV